jgi:hypothetical protein
MALRNEKAQGSTSKPMPRMQTERGALSATQQDKEMQRLLREAAWSRMFGKAAGPKNPFAR